MINYDLLHQSNVFYNEKGYIRIEAPWTVTSYISELTKPVGLQDYEIKHNHKVLVASGEQSFLYLYLKEFLPLGKYQTTTPCFRDDSFDYWHSKYFMKTELINTENTSENSLYNMIDNSLEFFKKHLPSISIETIKTNEGYDIIAIIQKQANGHITEVELGSYGVRENELLKWVYGTGCAEPRLSKVINLINR